MPDLLVLPILLGVSGLIGFAIGSGKGRGAQGFWLGFLLGFIGWIIVGVMEPSHEIRTARNAEFAMALNQRGSEGGWWPDPMGRHQHRYWDGTRWTDFVSDSGQQSIDLLNQ